MQVQTYKNNQNNPNFGALYINPAKIEQVVGKRYAKQAVDASPRLEKLAKDVDINVLPTVSASQPENLRYLGFSYVVSKMLPEQPRIKNPIKRFFYNLTAKKKTAPKIDDRIYFSNVPDNKTVADYLVDSVSKLKDKFIKLGGMD